MARMGVSDPRIRANTNSPPTPTQIRTEHSARGTVESCLRQELRESAIGVSTVHILSMNLELPNIPVQPCMCSALLFFCHSKKSSLDVVKAHKTAASISQHWEQANCGALIVPASSSTSAARSSLPSGGGS